MTPLMTPRIFGISMGWVPMAAGPVWMVLSVGMAVGATLLYRSASPQASLHGSIMVGFILLCWAHPLYTSLAEAAGVRRPVEFAGGIITLVVLIGVAAIVRRTSPGAAGFLAPVAVWLGLASVYLWQVLQAERA